VSHEQSLLVDTAYHQEMRRLANQWLHINVKSFCSSEVRIDAIFVQNDLSHTLFNKLVIERPRTQHSMQSYHEQCHLQLLYVLHTGNNTIHTQNITTYKANDMLLLAIQKNYKIAINKTRKYTAHLCVYGTSDGQRPQSVFPITDFCNQQIASIHSS